MQDNGKGRKLVARGLDVEAGPSGNVPNFSYPISSTTMDMVDVDRISFFDGNPRSAPNPKYEEIKESIRATGLDNPLPISHRPGDPDGHYIIYAGGNTRLQALKELWAETKDPRFLKAKCRYIAFQSDLDAKIMHLRENEMRGDMTFIDSALTIQAIKQGLEEELGEKLSLRRLEEELKKRGLGKSDSLLSKLEYVTKLNEFIPKALRVGMGRPQVERLQKLEKAALAVWRFHGNSGNRPGIEQVFRDKVFAPALAGSDSEAWAYEATESAVRLRLLASLPQGTDADTVQASLKLALAGKELKVPEPEPAPAPVPTHTVTSQPEPAYAPLDQYSLLGSDGVSGKPAATQAPPLGGTEPASDGGIRIEGGGGSPLWDSSLDDDDGLEEEEWMPHAPQRKEVVVEGRGRWMEKLKQLRGRNYALAVKLSNLHVPNGGDSIAELNVGYGFLPIQLFNPPFLVQLQRKSESDTDALVAFIHTACIWWFLAETAGLFQSDIENDRYICPGHVLDQYLDPTDGSPIHDQELLATLAPFPPPYHRLRTWWLKLTDGQLGMVAELVNNVRAINDIVLAHAKEAANATAWEITTGEQHEYQQ